jgi:cardiolipin synthase
VYSGKDYFFRLEQIIQNAKYEIHLQFYIFENDATELRDYRKIKEAAARRVKVYHYGWLRLLSFPKELVEELTESGAPTAFFLFQQTLFYIGRRLAS